MIRAMADNDAAFLWETEALRSTTPRSSSATTGTNGKTGDPDWVTLRRANEATGIPLKTLRKWARHEHVASYLEDSQGRQLRMVSLVDVRNRARRMGRQDDPVPEPTKEPPIRKQPPESSNQSASPPKEPIESEQPPGTMLVPIDAWDKMLLQLGNLHQAGQQLAEARERAGKAETESRFLRERVAEMRSELAEMRTTPPEGEELETQREPAPQTSSSNEAEALDDEGVTEDPGGIEQDGEILVQDLSPKSGPDDEGLTVAAYSLEMMKHVYSTWRGRPRR